MQHNNIHGRVLLCTLISSCQLTVMCHSYYLSNVVTLLIFLHLHLEGCVVLRTLERFEIQVGLYGIGGFHIKEDLLSNKWTESIALCYDVSKK